MSYELSIIIKLILNFLILLLLLNVIMLQLFYFKYSHHS